MNAKTVVRYVASWVAFVALAVGPAQAVSFGDTNLVDLLRLSETIVDAQVDSVTDGIDERGLPYTEITLLINEAIRGGVGTTYTFRQFGLLTPRSLGNGRMMPAAPEVFPRFTLGKRVLLFLPTPASVTGLQTTVALGLGKFDLNGGRAENALGNHGTFLNIGMEAGLANDLDRRILATDNGPVSPESLLALVRRAVNEQWIETYKMWKASEGKPGQKPVPPPGTVIPGKGGPVKPQINNSGSSRSN